MHDDWHILERSSWEVAPRLLGCWLVRELAGKLLVAGRSALSTDALEELQSFTSLAIEFQLVTQHNYEELQKLL